jgi:hypothetical protein
VLSCSVFGAGIHLSLHSESQIVLVRKALDSAGLPPVRLEPVPPTLEDVYLSLVRGEGGGEGP